MTQEQAKVERVTPARERVLRKAVLCGRVHAAGGFSPEPHSDPIEAEDFDTRIMVERLVREGMLSYGDGWNTYVPTQAGIAAIEAADRQAASA